MTEDAKSLNRNAQFLYVQYKKGSGSPPQYEVDWQELYNAKVETIVDNISATPSEAVFWLPNARWNDSVAIGFGDIVRIFSTDGIILFQGFIVNISQQFSGGNEQGGKYERLAFTCLDYRWMLAVGSIHYGEYGRSRDDYTNFGTPTQAPIIGKYTGFTARRCVFNAEGVNTKGVPNKDPEELTIAAASGYTSYNVPIFANPSSATAQAWTVYDMLRYVYATNQAVDYLRLIPPEGMADYDRFDAVLNNVSIEGLNTAQALQLILKQIGWAFRIDYAAGSPQLVLFKSGSAGDTTVLHTLFAPASLDALAPDGSEAPDVSKNIKTAVEAGKIILFSAQYENDIASVVNNPYYMGAPIRLEFTAELVPGWLDADLVPDTGSNNANLFFLEADLADMENPDQYTFFKNYHTRGSEFWREVGRVWALNESGRYTAAAYDRGMPFDFASVLPTDYILDKDGRRLFGPFDRVLLPCLTKLPSTEDSAGIIVEFSFDGGLSWHSIPAGIVSLDGQCGIFITESNLAEIAPKDADPINSGALDGIDLNYWTSLCRDKLDGNVFKTGNWKTRVRVTASIQHDQRLGDVMQPLASGSPFLQKEIWDFSDNYFMQARSESSIFSLLARYGSVDARNDYKQFKSYITFLRNSLQDASISGQFTLERLWLDTFHLGDCIEKIEGRDFMLRTSMGSTETLPEIIQIIYMAQHQKMKLITRDLRFSERK